MSGAVTPVSIGITDAKQLEDWLKVGRILFRLAKINCERATYLLAFVFTMSNYYNNLSILDTITFGVFHSVLFSVFGIHFMQHLTYQSVVFNLVARSIRDQLRSVNTQLKRLTRRKFHWTQVKRQMLVLDKIYCQIDVYNRTYASKYLANICCFVGVFTVFEIYLVIYAEVSMTVMLSSVYASLFFAGILQSFQFKQPIVKRKYFFPA